MVGIFVRLPGSMYRRLAALRRRPLRIRDVIGVRCGVQRPCHDVIGVRCGVQRPRRDVIGVRCGAHQQPAAGQPRQEQPAHVRRQRQSSVPRQPVLGNVPDIVGDASTSNRAFDPMLRGVGGLQRVVVNIGIPVQRLRVAWLRNKAIRRDEPSERRIIVAGMIIQQSGRITPLPGEGARRQSDAAGAHPSPRVIVLHSYECAARVRRCAHASQVVAEEILRSLVAAPHADDVGAEAVEVRRRAADGALPEVGDGDDGRRRCSCASPARQQRHRYRFRSHPPG